MKFGIHKISEDKYEWHLYERSTKTIKDKLYFPLSRPHYYYDKDIKISLNDTLLGVLNVTSEVSDNFDQLSYNKLNNIDNFISKEAPLQLDKEYFIDQIDDPLELNKSPLADSKQTRKLLSACQFHRETTLLDKENDKEETVYVFVNKDMSIVIFISPNE